MSMFFLILVCHFLGSNPGFLLLIVYILSVSDSFRLIMHLLGRACDFYTSSRVVDDETRFDPDGNLVQILRNSRFRSRLVNPMNPLFLSESLFLDSGILTTNFMVQRIPFQSFFLPPKEIS